MCHRLFLLAVYTVLASAILRVYHSIIMAPTLVPPGVLNARSLKSILEYRGVLYPGVVEKHELVGLVEASGVVHSNENEDYDIRPSPEPNPSNIHMFIGSDHFYEQVEDCKDSAWLVHVMTPNSKPIFGTGPWPALVDRLSSFGIRTGVFDCRLDTYLCLQRGWNTSRLLLAMPHVQALAKGSVVMQMFGGPINPARVQRWIYQQLADRVHRSETPQQMSRWLNESCSVTDVCVLLVSSLTLPPVFLSALSVKFTGRLSFGMAPAEVVDEVLGGGAGPEEHESEANQGSKSTDSTLKIEHPAEDSPQQLDDNANLGPTKLQKKGTVLISGELHDPVSENSDHSDTKNVRLNAPSGNLQGIVTTQGAVGGLNGNVPGKIGDAELFKSVKSVNQTAEKLEEVRDTAPVELLKDSQIPDSGDRSTVADKSGVSVPQPQFVSRRHRLVAIPTPSDRTGRYYWLARTDYNQIRQVDSDHSESEQAGDNDPAEHDDLGTLDPRRTRTDFANHDPGQFRQLSNSWNRVEYGMRHPAERANYPAFLDFLQWLFPDANDFFILTLAVANMCAVMTLFEFRSGSPVTHMLRFLWALLKYNVMLLVGWLLVLTLGQLPAVVRVADSFRTLLLRVTLNDVALTLRGDWRSMSTRMVIGSYLAYCSLIGWMRRRWWPFSSFSDDGFGEQTWTDWLISYGRNRSGGLDTRTLTADERHILLFLRRQYDTPGAYLAMSEHPTPATQETLRLISQLPVWKYHAPTVSLAANCSGASGRIRRSASLCVRCKLIKKMKLRRLAQRFSRHPCTKCGFSGKLYNHPVSTTSGLFSPRAGNLGRPASSRQCTSSSSSFVTSFFWSRGRAATRTTSSSNVRQLDSVSASIQPSVDWSDSSSNQNEDNEDNASPRRFGGFGLRGGRGVENNNYEHHNNNNQNAAGSAMSDNYNCSPISPTPTVADSEYGDCRICLEPYREGEDLCGLPCDHGYHRKCILPWLLSGQHVCPLCRGAAFVKA